MKKLTLLIILCFSFYSLGLISKDQTLYQVVTAHPHDLEKLGPYLVTVHKEGRLWLAHLKPGTPAKLYKFLRATDSSDVRSYTPSMKSFPVADEEIQQVLSEISIANIKKDVATLAGFRNRAAGTDDNRKATEFIRSRFAEFGFEIQQPCYQEGKCSVVADKIGSTHPEDVIIVVAHFDSVGKPFAGADDNGSGTAVMMEMARVLKSYPNKKTLRFFATNGEELGLLGAQHYANSLVSSGKIKNIVLDITMDMVGYNSNGVVELETDREYEKLAQWFVSLAGTYTTLKTKITLGAWGSDHVPFLRAGVSTLLTIEDWSTKTPCYHMECDKPDTINYNYAGEITKLNVSAIMTKDLEIN